MKWYWYALAFILGFGTVYLWYRAKKKANPNFKMSIDTIESEIGITTATEQSLMVH
jgi:hypothetical protein